VSWRRMKERRNFHALSAHEGRVTKGGEEGVFTPGRKIFCQVKLRLEKFQELYTREKKKELVYRETLISNGDGRRGGGGDIIPGPTRGSKHGGLFPDA